MRYRLAALMLLAVLPLMNVLAAPAPEPYAILDIGPPPKGETAEQYRKRQIEAPTSPHGLSMWWSDAGVRKLPSVAAMKDARPWMAKNLRITEEEGGRRLRFTFQAGTREERVALLNALLRIKLSRDEENIKHGEETLRKHEKTIADAEKHMASGTCPADLIAAYRKGIDELRANQLPELRTAIARLKQIGVIQWAK